MAELNAEQIGAIAAAVVGAGVAAYRWRPQKWRRANGHVDPRRSDPDHHGGNGHTIARGLYTAEWYGRVTDGLAKIDGLRDDVQALTKSIEGLREDVRAERITVGGRLDQVERRVLMAERRR